MRPKDFDLREDMLDFLTLNQQLAPFRPANRCAATKFILAYPLIVRAGHLIVSHFLAGQRLNKKARWMLQCP